MDKIPTDFEIAAAMTRYGGSFAVAFAECWHRADEKNAAKLKAAFPALIAEYADLAVHHARQSAKDEVV